MLKFIFMVNCKGILLLFIQYLAGDKSELATSEMTFTNVFFPLIQPSGIVKRSSVTLCGEQLVNAIILACSQYRRKRSIGKSFLVESPFVMVVPVFLTQGLSISGNFNSDYGLEETAAAAEAAAASRGDWLIDPPSSSRHGSLGGRHSSDSVAFKKFETMGMLKRLQKRGPSDECCFQSCPLSHLITYC
jgi:hypothetical protein